MFNALGFGEQFEQLKEKNLLSRPRMCLRIVQ